MRFCSRPSGCRSAIATRSYNEHKRSRMIVEDHSLGFGPVGTSGSCFKSPAARDSREMYREKTSIACWLKDLHALRTSVRRCRRQFVTNADEDWSFGAGRAQFSDRRVVDGLASQSSLSGRRVMNMNANISVPTVNAVAAFANRASAEGSEADIRKALQTKHPRQPGLRDRRAARCSIRGALRETIRGISFRRLVLA